MSRLLMKNIQMSFQGRTLATDSKYGFLTQLGISAENPGVFDGTWRGSGKVSFEHSYHGQKVRYQKYINFKN